VKSFFEAPESRNRLPGSEKNSATFFAPRVPYSVFVSVWSRRRLKTVFGNQTWSSQTGLSMPELPGASLYLPGEQHAFPFRKLGRPVLVINPSVSPYRLS